MGTAIVTLQAPGHVFDGRTGGRVPLLCRNRTDQACPDKNKDAPRDYAHGPSFVENRDCSTPDTTSRDLSSFAANSTLRARPASRKTPSVKATLERFIALSELMDRRRTPRGPRSYL